MRKFEIILKLLFLAGAVNFIIAKSIDSIGFIVFLIVCFALGIILIVNKNSSYNYPQTKKDYIIRRTEGTFLIVFSILISSLYFLNA